MSRYFENELIEQIKDANDIVSVISEHVALKKRGKNYWGCCPFHNEKTPSFSVAPDKGFYYCFGCHASGNAIKFLMELDHLTFVEALERLANRANIPLPEAKLSPEQRARDERRKKLYEACDLAATFFHNCLTQTSMGKPGLDYLKRRGLTKETIEKFKLGFAPDGWDKLYHAFHERGIEDSILLELNLVRKNQKGQFYDFFRNRVMFPIMDGKGRVVAFGGRVMDDSTPKYLNSPESPIFEKGKILFAFDKAYKSIRQEKQAILVEGYMDVISAHNQGVTNVVASLGTAYTKDHGHILMRQADEIVLAYDMDGAGRQAASRAIELLQNTDFKVRVLAMPDGKDPDDYVRNHGAKAFKELIAQAVKPLDYLLSESLIKHDTNDTEGKQAVLADVFPYIANIHSQTQRDDALKALALPLWLDNSSIFRYFRDYVKKGQIELVDMASVLLPTKELVKGDEERLLSLAFTDGDVLQEVMNYLPLEDFQKNEYRVIIEKIYTLFMKEHRLDESSIQSVLTAQEYDIYSRLLVMCDDDDKVQVPGLIRKIRLHSLREQYKTHSIMADQLKRAGDSTFISELHKCQDIQNLIREWSK
ncbi:DNA primase [Veillonella denticariosi JCM 15641]|uniref:DNA primase n=1 Tax=Veillonella denticariosi JCM 15641 TaxID=1298594 RepID=A0A2S7Z7V8_9FIRM|nr:DNA primase [Veillonella denticariosi]PQL19366.1 DNA primase [Veillonella denticariosi JCM 15641]